MFNIQQLIQAAEYLDRRERGEKMDNSVDFMRAFSNFGNDMLTWLAEILVYSWIICEFLLNFQKLNMDMHPLFQCQTIIVQRRGQNLRNLREIGRLRTP